MNIKDALDLDKYPYLDARLGRSVIDPLPFVDKVTKEDYSEYLKQTNDYCSHFIEHNQYSVSGIKYRQMFEAGFIPLCLNPVLLVTKVASVEQNAKRIVANNNLEEFKQLVTQKANEVKLPILRVPAPVLTPNPVISIAENDPWVHRMEAVNILNLKANYAYVKTIDILEGLHAFE